MNHYPPLHLHDFLSYTPLLNLVLLVIALVLLRKSSLTGMVVFLWAIFIIFVPLLGSIAFLSVEGFKKSGGQ